MQPQNLPPRLVDINGLAHLLHLSRQGAHDYLKRNPEFAAAARVMLGVRSTRYSVAVIDQHVADIVAVATGTRAEPAALAAARS